MRASKSASVSPGNPTMKSDDKDIGFEQCFEYFTADFGGAWLAGHTKMIAATGNFHVQAGFDLSKVFIELAAEVGQALVIGGLENDIS